MMYNLVVQNRIFRLCEPKIQGITDWHQGSWNIIRTPLPIFINSRDQTFIQQFPCIPGPSLIGIQKDENYIGGPTFSPFEQLKLDQKFEKFLVISRDYLLHILFWTNYYNPLYSNRTQSRVIKIILTRHKLFFLVPPGLPGWKLRLAVKWKSQVQGIEISLGELLSGETALVGLIFAMTPEVNN